MRHAIAYYLLITGVGAYLLVIGGLIVWGVMVTGGAR